MESTALAAALQEVLTHLYDTRYLHQHPLAANLVAHVGPADRGRALHQRLKEAIEQLRPPEGTPEHAVVWRTYRYLTLRYVHALTMHQVAHELGITQRHCRRVHKDALTLLAQSLGETGLHHPSEDQLTQRSAEHLTDHQLLEDELMRVGTGDEPVASLHATVQGVVATLETLAKSAGVVLRVSFDPSGDSHVMRIALRQILFNLLVHAIQRHPGSTIVVSTRVAPSTSVGISVQTSTHVAHPSDDEHFTVARRLAELRGGTLSICQTPETVDLVVTFPPIRVRTVLLIDDNPDFLQLFRRYLAGQQYHVHCSTNVDEALLIAQRQKPDVITLDVLMPQQDGWEVLQRLKNHRLTRGIPIVVCSVLPDRDLAYSLGASAFLPKPVDQTALLTALDHAVYERDSAALAPDRYSGERID